MSSDVVGETGRIIERASPCLMAAGAARQVCAPRVSDWACRVLAGMNEAIISASDRRGLYADVCQILVHDGGYTAAWIEAVDAGSMLPPAARADCTEPGRLSRTSVQVPLHHGGRLVAVLSLDQGRPEVFGGPDEPVRPGASDEADLLRRVAANVSFALGTLADAELMRELAAHRGRLVHGIVSAEQRERVRIADDIHDESVPLLAALELRLDVLGRSDAAADPTVRTTLDEIQTTLARAAAGLRDLLFELDDDGADDLLEAVREAADQILLPCGVTWKLSVDGEVQLPGIERLQVLRIIKEALVNVRKHARARAVLIEVLGAPDGVEVAVTDDGVGLDGTPVRRPGHRGLSSMRHRAEVSGGWLRVEPRQGGGTTVRFAVPVTTAELDEA